MDRRVACRRLDAARSGTGNSACSDGSACNTALRVARLRISGVREGVLLLPFHYGYWDTDAGHEPDGHGRAANELTLTDWDPASKQPIFKTAAAAAVRIKESDGTSTSAPTTTGSRPVTGSRSATRGDATALVHEELEPTGESR